MDNIAKLLKKLRADERAKVERVIVQVRTGDFENLDVKKLKGHSGIFRVRARTLRIVFKKEGSVIAVLFIERRSDTTYK